MRYYYQRQIILLCAIVLITCNKPVTEAGETQNPIKPALAISGPYSGNEDHAIFLEEAAKMTSSYRAENPEGPYAWYFGKKAIEKILAQEGCVGIRIYGGVNETGHISPVIVGVLSSGANLAKGELAERAPPCPPECGELTDMLNQ